MEYQVPQFIEVEDKIFGPFTWKQFVFLAGGVGLSVIIFLYLPIVLALVLIIGVMSFASALSFYRINNRTFIDILGAGFTYYTKGRLYLWKKEDKSNSPQISTPIAMPERQKLVMTRGKLHDLALSLDIQDQNNPQQ